MKKKIVFFGIIFVGLIFSTLVGSVFLEVIKMNRLTVSIEASRDIARQLNFLRIDTYYIQANIWKYYYDPKADILDDIWRQSGLSDIHLTDLLNLERSSEYFYPGGDKDFREIEEGMGLLQKISSKCFSSYDSAYIKGDNEEMKRAVKDCSIESQRTDFENKINTVTGKQIAYYRGLNERMVASMESIQVIMIFLIGIYAVLLVLIAKGLLHCLSQTPKK